MTCRELLEACMQQNEELMARAGEAQSKLSNEELNRAPAGGWSPAQIFEHLCLANAPYIDTIGNALMNAQEGDDAEVRYSWFGRLIFRASSPDGNAPSPKALVPAPGPYGRDVFEKWKVQQEQLLALHRQAKGKNLSAAKIRNPFIKLFKMTLCDFIAILATHTERHIRQIEERVSSTKA